MHSSDSIQDKLPVVTELSLLLGRYVTIVKFGIISVFISPPDGVSGTPYASLRKKDINCLFLLRSRIGQKYSVCGSFFHPEALLLPY